MQKIRYLIIALMCMVVQGALAQEPTWTEVGDKDALNTAVQTDGANIKLTADIALSNYLGIGDGENSKPTVTIDLNGHTLSRSLDAADGNGHVIWVRTGSTLTVIDSSDNPETPEYDGNGKLTGGYATNGGGICNYGTLYFQSGTITSCQTDYTGGAIRNNGTATISGGVITNCSAPYGGALYNTGTLTISGGTISNSSSTTGGGGGLVNIGTVEISGGTFSGNTAKTNGGGIWNGNSGNAHGTLTITGASITGNTATNYGGGIWNENEVTISSGSITSNTAGTNGGGVFTYSNINLSGNTVINSNTVNGSANNLYLNGNSTVINCGTFTTGASIYVTLQKRNRVITSGYHDNNGSTAPTTIFFPDYSGQRFMQEGNEVRHTTTSATATSVATEEQLNTAISQGKTEIQLLADIVLQSYVGITGNKTVTLDLNGFTLSRSLSEADGFGSVIFIEEGSTLYVKDSSGDNSGKLTGGYSVNGGGIRNHGTLTFEGGTITSCQASSCGGGIYNAKASENATNATLYMTGGVITGNTGQDCGGIYNAEGSTTEISGGTISNCTSNQGGGGINNKGTMTISGGTISGNHASERGGGVWNGGEASLTITGGTITGNRADTAGGGVFTYSSISMSGSPNITGNEGSNLYLNGSSTVINCAYRSFTSDAIIGISLSDYNRVITNGYSDFHSWSYAYEGKYTCFSTDVEGAVFDNKLYDNDDMEVVLKDQNGVEYFVCSWTGSNTEGHVVKTKKLCKSYTQYSSNTDDKSLNAGWYVFKGTFTFNKRVTINGDANFILKDGCSVEFDKGIHIPDGKTLTIYAQSDGDSKGYLWTDGSDGENGSIGGNKDNCGGHLVIHGGKIYAKPGSNNSAGIGGGDGSSSGMQSVTIYGGNITAEGKSSGAGIGSGQENNTSPSVTIYGGKVTAKGGNYAAGIGGGEECTNGTIKIFGGTVTATGGGKSGSGGGAAGIGSGEESSQNNPIYIYGGTVNATGGQCGAGIGGAYKGNGGSVYVYGGNVTATGGQYGAGIGGGYRYTSTSAGRGGTLTVTGGTVNATGGEYSSGIGGGYKAQGGTVTISNGNVTATGGTWGAGIGGGWAADGGNVTISGGSVTVAAGTGAYAIGRGADRNSGSDGSLTLGNTISVKQSGGSWVGSGSRVSTVRANGTYILQNCTHSGATYADKEDGTYHTISCSYCLGDDEAHTYGSDGKCTKCSYTSPEGAKTVTIYEANADGTAYDNGQCSMVNGQSTFTLPSCSSDGGLTFLGWAPGAPADGEDVTTDGEETLMKAGTEIAVTDDVNFKARYERVWNGSGTEANPYQIDVTEDWNKLATNVSNGTTYSGKFFQLTNDISVTTMVGQGSNRFLGKFDGQGHTITVNLTATENYCAPFRCISGATIKNLNTAGTIETSARYAAGVVAYTRYYSTIENCRSSVTIRSNNEGWAGHGGILGLKANVSDSKPTIEGCVFDGKILSTGAPATTGGGGIVGLTNGQTLTIKNCLYKPAALEEGENAVAVSTIYANSSSVPSTVTCTDCYYTEAYGSAESGTQGYTVTSGTEGLTLDYGTATTDYGYNGIMAYSFGLLYQNVLYSGEGKSVTLNAVTAEDKVATGVAASEGTLNGDAQNGYTLTMAAANSSVTATIDDKVLDNLHLSDASANTTTIEGEKGKYYNVTIDNRTLYKDGSWNTLCLPFDVSAGKISVHPQLQGCTIMELDVDGWYDDSGNRHDDYASGYHQTGYDDGTLYLYFQTVTDIDARRPYLIKWTKPEGYDASPSSFDFTPTFFGSYIESSSPRTVTSIDGKVSFCGNYDPEEISGNKYLYLGTGNQLYYPSSPRTINAFRAYFQLNGIEAGEVAQARMFFGDNDETTGIVGVEHGILNIEHSAGTGWYDLSGRKLSGKPTQKGVYIYNGNKRIIK